MKKPKFIVFLSMVVTPMILFGIPKFTTAINSTSHASSLIEFGRLDKTDEDIFQGTPISLITMKSIKTISKSILNIFNNVNKSSSFETLEKIASKMKSFINNLNKTGINLYEESNIIYSAQISKIRVDLKALSIIINDIDFLFKDYYLEYLNGHVTNTSLQIFISKAIGLDADSPEKNSFMLQKILFPRVIDTPDSSLLKKIINDIKKGNNSFCSTHQTPQQFMYNLYYSLAIAEFKTYIMILSAYKLHAVTSNDDCRKDLERVQVKHFERMKNYLTEFVNIFHQLSFEIKACFREPMSYKIANDILAINKLLKESDYHNNMVVTGVHFVIHKNVLHVQIEEGKLIANGQILLGSNKWLPLDDMDYLSDLNTQNEENIRIGQSVKYHPVTSSCYWYLKNAHAPPNFVVIGANLEVYRSEKEFNEVIYMKLKFAKMNATTAQLDTNEIKYSDDLSNDPPELGDENLVDNAKFVYLREKEKSIYSTVFGNRTIQVIPFIDTQVIYGNPRLPLTGISTFNKKSSKSNTILLKALTLDFSSLVDIN